MASLLACRSRRSTGIIGNRKNNRIPIGWASFKILVFPLDFGYLAFCHGRTCKGLWMKCDSSVLSLPWQLKKPQLRYAPPKNRLNTCLPYHKLAYRYIVIAETLVELSEVPLPVMNGYLKHILYSNTQCIKVSLQRRTALALIVTI